MYILYELYFFILTFINKDFYLIIKQIHDIKFFFQIVKSFNLL